MSHDIELNSDLLTHATVQAAAVAGDVRSGTAQPPGEHVKYVDPPHTEGTWKAPATVNATGAASCNSLTRAAAPFEDASHIAVKLMPSVDGKPPATHSFIVKADPEGKAPITIAGDGKALSPIPAERIVDPSVKAGMNGGNPLPLEAYQGATLAPIWPPHTTDLSHVHAPADDRAAEGNAYQGAPRIHTPATAEGAVVVETAHLAARPVAPPPEHAPRPIGELYEHPVLGEIAKVEDKLKEEVGWKTTPALVNGFAGGLLAIAKGNAPPGASLPSDPPITPAHSAAAKAMLDFLVLLQKAEQRHPGAQEELDRFAAELAAVDHASPPGDAIKTVVSEVDGMLPKVVPPHVRKHAASARKPTPEPEFDPYYLIQGTDKGDGLGSFAMGFAMGEALAPWSVGHPDDGVRPPRPRRTIDPRMGAAGGGGGHGGGGGGGAITSMVPSAPSAPASTSSSSLLAPSDAASASSSSAPYVPGMSAGSPYDPGSSGRRPWGRGGERHPWLGGGDESIDVTDCAPSGDGGGDDESDGGDECVTITDTTYASAPAPATIVRPQIVVQQPSAPAPIIERPRIDIIGEAPGRPRKPGFIDRWFGGGQPPPTQEFIGGRAGYRQEPGWRGYTGRDRHHGVSNKGGEVATKLLNNSGLASKVASKDPNEVTHVTKGLAQEIIALKKQPQTAAVKAKIANLQSEITQVANDPSMRGIGDMYLLDPGLRHSVEKYMNGPFFRARIDAGERSEWGNFGYADIQAALGRHRDRFVPERIVFDPFMRGMGAIGRILGGSYDPDSRGAKEDPRMGKGAMMGGGGLHAGGHGSYSGGGSKSWLGGSSYTQAPASICVFDDGDDLPTFSPRVVLRSACARCSG